MGGHQVSDLVIVSVVSDAAATGLIDVPEDQAERLVAQQRWYYLSGLYTGRNCDQQLAAAAAQPAAQPAMPDGAGTPSD